MSFGCLTVALTAKNGWLTPNLIQAFSPLNKVWV